MSGGVLSLGTGVQQFRCCRRRTATGFVRRGSGIPDHVCCDVLVSAVSSVGCSDEHARTCFRAMCSIRLTSDSLLLLLYEDMMADMDLAQQQIASHLRVGVGLCTRGSTDV